MNIFGEGFPEEIKKQVDDRQKVYGSGYSDGASRTPEEILYLNSKTSWCKLVSGVNIEDINKINNPTIKSLGLSGDTLAKQFVLFNGTADSTGKGLRAGINLDNSLLGGDNAYGIGGNDFGIRPMMGIISADINHENRGSLRRATIKIKAFNKAQFEIVDVLYLRLGFYVLLEWGHTMTIDKDGVIQTNPTDYSLALDFLNGTTNGKAATYEDFLKRIHDQRLASSGNYDAMFAKVTNFHWSFLPDGSYDITVNLSSVGDIIESLKMNPLITGLKAKVSTDEKSTEEEKNAEKIISYWANINTIGSFFYTLQQLIKTSTSNEDKGGISSLSLNDSNVSDKQSTINSTPSLMKIDLSKFVPNMTDFLSIILKNPDFGGGVDNWFTKDNSKRYYVRLGTFLQFIQEYIVPRIINTTSVSLLNIDFDETTNIINLEPMQVAVDPSICIVNRTVDLGPKDNIKTYIFGRQDQQNPFQNKDINIANHPDLYANIMNVYVDCAFVLSRINELKDDQGNLSLIDFLQNLMNGINKGLGGINDFDVFIDETTNTIKIIDKNPLKNLDEVIQLLNDQGKFPTLAKYNGGKPLNTSQAFFDLYGYYNGTGNAGFIKDFSFTTELTPAFSTMITVGAAANGTVVGENDTALSRINKGLSDRYKKDITNNPAQTSAVTDYKTDAETKWAEYDNIINPYYEFLYDLSNGTSSEPHNIETSPEAVNSNQNTLSSLLQKRIEVDDAQQKYNASVNPNLNFDKTLKYPGFIPFNISLTMDGLSGMKINQQFNIDTRYLPSNYPENVRFLIKNLSHKIENNRWWTKMESYCITKSGTTNLTPAQANNQNNQSNNTPNPPTPSPRTPKPVTPPGNRDRCAIKTIGSTKYASQAAFVNFFKSKGYSKAGIAGLLANIIRESNLNLNNFNSAGGGCGAYGLAQWRSSRQTDLYNYARSIGQPIDSEQTQFGFIYKEIETSHSRVRTAMRSQNTSEDNIKTIAFIVSDDYEGFTGSNNINNHEVQARRNLAITLFRKI